MIKATPAMIRAWLDNQVGCNCTLVDGVSVQDVRAYVQDLEQALTKVALRLAETL